MIFSDNTYWLSGEQSDPFELLPVTGSCLWNFLFRADDLRYADPKPEVYLTLGKLSYF